MGHRLNECVGKTIRTEWVWQYILLGIFTSVAGAFVALTTMVYARQTMCRQLRKGYWYFVASSGVSLGGSAIWSMHFIGMKALVLRRCDGDRMNTVYNGALSGVSLVAAIACTAVAMHFVMPTTQTKPLIDDDDDDDSSTATRERKFSIVLFGRSLVLVRFNHRRFTFSSVLLTVAALMMHYLGMMSQHGPYTMTYSPYLILLSALVGFFAASAGLFIIVQIAAINDLESLHSRFIAAVIIGGAVNALHYTGEESATYIYKGTSTEALTNGILGPNVQIDARTVCIVALAADIMQLSLAQHYITKLFAALPKKIATLDKLARQQAHEMRNKYCPALSVMEQFIEMAQKHDASVDDFTALFEDVALALTTLREVEVQHQARLDIYKIMQGSYVPCQEIFDVVAFMRERVNVERAIATAHRMRGTYDGGEDVHYGYVIADPTYEKCDAIHIRTDMYILSHVASNLLSNARKFTHAGSVLFTMVKADFDDGLLTFTVRDTGTGLPPAVVDTLFHHEVATGDVRGTGLGLPSCHLFCRAGGGTIQLKETKSRTSTVRGSPNSNLPSPGSSSALIPLPRNRTPRTTSKKAAFISKRRRLLTIPSVRSSTTFKVTTPSSPTTSASSSSTIRH